MTRARLFFLAVLLLPVLAWFPAPATAQRSNTFYAEQFAGPDVATKVTNAMAACSPSTSVPCYIYLDSSLNAYPVGNMPSLCSQCSLIDFRAGVPWPSSALTTDSANNSAFRNGGNSQSVAFYNTNTDASNYERLRIFYSGGDGSFHVQSEQAGTGTGRGLVIGPTSGSSFLYFAAGGSSRWYVNQGGNFYANTDNAYDIGQSGANRPRNMYLAGNLTLGGTCTGCGGTLSVATTTIGGASVNPMNVASGTVSLAGVVAGTPCIAMPTGGQLPGGMVGFTSYAVGTSSNTVTVTLTNVSAGALTPSSLSYNVRCWL